MTIQRQPDQAAKNSAEAIDDGHRDNQWDQLNIFVA